jgi:hypothetical protein
MAEAVLQQETSYQRWTNFKWADVIRLTALTRVFTQHFLPNSNKDATKLGITNPEAWSRREETKVPEKKVVKQAITPPPEKTAASSGSKHFIISLVSDSDEEETPAGTDTTAPAAAASAAADDSADTSSPVGKKRKRGSCLENGCVGFLKTDVSVFSKRVCVML